MRVLLNIISVISFFYSITTLPVEEDYYNDDNSTVFMPELSPTSKSGRPALSKAGNVGISRSGTSNKPRHWPGGHIPVEYFKRSLPRASWKMLQNAIATIEYWTCVRFIPYVGHSDHLEIISNKKKGCDTQGIVGYQGGVHRIYLEAPTCYDKIGNVLHMLLHIVGLQDEHRRPERDQFLLVHDQNIEAGKKQHFTKYTEEDTNNYGVPYDYGSVMHADETAYSANGLKTLEATVPGIKIGQRDGMSVRDAIRVNKMYQCFYKLNTSIHYSEILPNIFTTKRDKDKLNMMYITRTMKIP